MPQIDTARILFLASDGFEQSALTVPLAALQAAGARVQVAAPKSRRRPEAIRGWDRGDWGQSVKVDVDIESIDQSRFHALMLPGAQINPDKLRIEPRALELIRAFVTGGMVVAAFGYAPSLLIEVGAVRGRRLTCARSISTDVFNAGGILVDEEAVIDSGIVTGRDAADLDAFVAMIIEEIERGGHAPRQLAA